jgi:KDO2-lipid IV(A) lauroyltransferase
LKHSLPKRLLDSFLYAYARSVTGFQTATPWDVARVNARLAGDMGYWMDRPSRRQLALANLRKAFPEWSDEQALETLKEVYRHLSESVLDSLKVAAALVRGEAAQLIELEGFDRLEELHGDTGIIFVTGHFGHWEVLGATASLIGYPVWSMARPLRHAALARDVARLRRASGQGTIPAKGGLRKAIRLLQGGQNIAVLIDQNVRRGGVFVDFFGRPASTTPGPARMAMYTGAPVAFVYARRIPGQNRFRTVLSDVILPRQDGDVGAETLRITQQFTRDLEEAIRAAPAEWFWLHRRWRTSPWPPRQHGETVRAKVTEASGRALGAGESLHDG